MKTYYGKDGNETLILYVPEENDGRISSITIGKKHYSFFSSEMLSHFENNKGIIAIQIYPKYQLDWFINAWNMEEIVDEEGYSDEVKELATTIHLSCTSNHADGCFWFYGENGKEYWYKEASKLLPKIKEIGISLSQLRQLMLVLYPHDNSWLE